MCVCACVCVYRETKKSKGLAYIQYTTADAAVDAYRALDGIIFQVCVCARARLHRCRYLVMCKPWHTCVCVYGLRECSRVGVWAQGHACHVLPPRAPPSRHTVCVCVC